MGCHFLLQCMKVKSESEVSQSWLTLSDPMDCSLPGSSAHGIFQARVLEWGAIAFSFFIYSEKQIVHQNENINAIMPNGEGNGTPLQYSCLENPMGRGAWWAAVHGVAKSQT